MKAIVRELTAGGAGVLALFLLLISGMPFVYIVPAAVLVYFGTRLMLPAESRKLQVELPQGIDQAEYRAYLGRCATSLRNIERLGERIMDARFRAQVEQLGHLTADLIGNFERDPGDVRLARAFPERLERITGMLESYLDLSGQRAQSEQTRRAMEVTQTTVGKANEKFQELHRRFLENDALNLSTDARTLNNLLDFD